MTLRILSGTLMIAAFAACSDSQGQKGGITLTNEMDSVSYAIGADIGRNFKSGKLDSVNVDALAAGLRDALDSTMQLQGILQTFMMKRQLAQQAEEQKKTDEALAAEKAFLEENGKRKGVVTTASGLQYEVITMGTGPKPKAEDRVTVHYTGTLIDGTKFDSSVDRGQPMTHPVAQFVPGWVEALQLMPVGSKWNLYLPSELGYGPGSSGPIPPNSVLIFEMELLEIAK